MHALFASKNSTSVYWHSRLRRPTVEYKMTLNTAIKTILLFTHSRDFYTIDNVQSHLIEQGINALRVDTDTYPTALGLNIEWRADETKIWLSAKKQTINLNDVHAIWFRRNWPNAAPLPDLLDRSKKARSAQECETAFFDILSLLDKPYQLNKPEHHQKANRKIIQLEAASRLGLPLAPSLVSNDIDQIALFQNTENKIITKTLSAYLSQYGLAKDFAFTQKVKHINDNNLSHIRYTPQIFQSEIDKIKEYRLIILGDKHYIGSIEIKNPDQSPIDWRDPKAIQDAEWKRDTLPEALIKKSKQLLKALNLEYGALDIALDKNNQLWFFEINPGGEYGWFERDLGYPISKDIASCLINRGYHADINI